MSATYDHLAAARLDGKAFVILGAGGGGIGTATCEAFAAAGAKLLCVDRNPANAEEIAAATNGVPYTANVTDRSEMEVLFAKADELFGDGFAGLVDIVGLARTGKIVSWDDDAIRLQDDIVYRHALLAIQIAAPILKRNGGGTMAFVSSMSSERVTTNQAIYGIAKAALDHLVRTAAVELGPDGIRVNAVSPGFVRTPRLIDAFPQSIWDGISAVNPLRRCAEPEDIAKSLLFLSSDLSSYVNGNVMRLDGGYGNAWTLPGLDEIALGGGSK
jgi:NAD(P)-dependent dehydrogenase (short-subunit alcohol dehydrogenase family)